MEIARKSGYYGSGLEAFRNDAWPITVPHRYLIEIKMSFPLAYCFLRPDEYPFGSHSIDVSFGRISEFLDLVSQFLANERIHAFLSGIKNGHSDFLLSAVRDPRDFSSLIGGNPMSPQAEGMIEFLAFSEDYEFFLASDHSLRRDALACTAAYYNNMVCNFFTSILDNYNERKFERDIKEKLYADEVESGMRCFFKLSSNVIELSDLHRNAELCVSSDEEVAWKIKEELKKRDLINTCGVHVSVLMERIILSGFVEDESSKLAVENIVGAIVGRDFVKNELHVRGVRFIPSESTSVAAAAMPQIEINPENGSEGEAPSRPSWQNSTP